MGLVASGPSIPQHGDWILNVPKAREKTVAVGKV